MSEQLLNLKSLSTLLQYRIQNTTTRFVTVSVREAEAIIAAISPWRHLDNEKPEDGEYCMVWSEALGYIKAIYQASVDAFYNLDEYDIDPPRFWMPMPEPPQEKNNAD